MRSSIPNISIEKQLHYAEKGESGGVDIREPSTALLGISSVDRYRAGLSASQVNPLTNSLPSSLSSPYDFSLTTLGQNLLTGFFTRLAVNEVQFRWTIPTITARNNRMYIYIAPNNNFSLSSASHSGTTTTFTLSSATGYVAGQVIQVLSSNVGGQVLSGTYTIASVSGASLICNDPNNLTDFGTTTIFGSVFVRGLITIPDGWYDLNNQDETTASAGGNLAFQFQTAVRGITSIAPLVNLFTCDYSLQYQGTANSTAPLPVVAYAQPYNVFKADNSTSTGASVFFFGRYTDVLRPNAVGLFEMMAWYASQLRSTVQWSSPNVSMLSTPFVDIVCDQLTANQGLKDADSGDISRTMLCRLYLTPDAFTGNLANLGYNPILIHRCFPFPKQIRWNPAQPIGNLRFSVYDSQGYILTTGEGLSGTMTTPPNVYDSDMGDWSLTLLVSEV
jgi:hypothetical protein